MLSVNLGLVVYWSLECLNRILSHELALQIIRGVLPEVGLNRFRLVRNDRARFGTGLSVWLAR